MSGASSVAYTFSYNEQTFLPIWLEYYAQAVDHIIVCDHGSNDGSIKWAEAFGAEIRVLDSGRLFDYEYTNRKLREFHKELIEQFDVVVYADADEFIVPVDATLRDYIQGIELDRAYCSGFHVLQGDNRPMDWRAPLLGQRNTMSYDANYCKPLIATEYVDWVTGTHYDKRDMITGQPARQDSELLLLHMKYADWEEYQRRTKNRFPEMSQEDMERAWNKVQGNPAIIPQSVKHAF